MDESRTFDMFHTSQILAPFDEPVKTVEEMVRLAGKSCGVSALREVNEA